MLIWATQYRTGRTRLFVPSYEIWAQFFITAADILNLWKVHYNLNKTVFLCEKDLPLYFSRSVRKWWVDDRLFCQKFNSFPFHIWVQISMPPSKITPFLRAPRTLQGRLSVSIESKLPFFLSRLSLLNLLIIVFYLWYENEWFSWLVDHSLS